MNTAEETLVKYNIAVATRHHEYGYLYKSVVKAMEEHAHNVLEQYRKELRESIKAKKVSGPKDELEPDEVVHNELLNDILSLLSPKTEDK